MPIAGIYTRYILEAWITWRACVQMSVLGPSSFTTIPDNYYDRIRVKCMNTIIRHMQSPDADKYGMFVHPDALGYDYLKEQE